jgi:hypothetical protein
MAVFSAIATAIVGAIGVTGIAATIATSIIGAGLALGTAKVLGVFEPPKQQDSKDPGVKIQLPPSTDNRIPVFYGNNYSGGIIVDAGISNQNNTMAYVMVIGEKTDSGTYIVNKVFRDDAELTFSGTTNTVSGQIDPNSTTSNNINGKIRINVFAGNAQSNVNQIFPVANKVAAQTLLPTITASTNYEDLVYAVVSIDYDPENGLTGLGAITFKIQNTLNEPSNVLLDYLQNTRYGAGLSSGDLDLPSFNNLYDHANINGSTGNVEYTTNANVSAYHSRYQIDGMLSTYVSVKQNINEMCKSCSTFFTYDSKLGKFKVVPNREATTAEKNAAFVLNDDNIISPLEITSTELYSMFNSIEAEYPSYEQKDQTKTVFIDTPSGDRNTNEPDNPLQARFNLVNDAPRVHNLANIDLRQGRLSTVVSCTADYSAIQIDVGDIVKLTNSLYGYSEKLFRVMRVTEIENGDAMLAVKLILLEYDDSVYTHNVITSDSATLPTGIPGWWTGIWGNVDYSNIANIINGNITIVDDPLGSNANVISDPTTGIVTGNTAIGNIDIGIGGIGIGAGGGVIPSINVPITIPDIPGISHIIANLNPTGSSTGSNVANIIPPTVVPVMPPAGNTSFVPGETINVTLPQPVMPLQDQSFSVGPLLPDITANLDLSMINVMGVSSKIATAPNITLAPKGQIDRGKLGDVQAGLQIEEDLFNDDMANSAQVSVPLGTDAALVSTNTLIDVGAIDEGIFSAVNNMVPYGSTLVDGNAAISFQPFRTINYKAVDVAPDGKMTANTTITNVSETVLGSGIQATGINQLGTFDDNFKYEVSRDRGSFIANAAIGIPASPTLQYIPANVVVGNWANTNLSNTGGQSRRLDVTNSDKRISKSDTYLDIGGFF